MISLQEICVYLDELLECSKFADNCPNGLQVEGKKEITKLATGVSASLETIEAAIEWGADALLVHHGMFWNKDSYLIVGSKKEKILSLLKNKISLLAYHLPLDAHSLYGNNWRAAKEMGWDDLEPFGSYNGVFIGVKGHIQPLPIQEFQKKLEEYYQHPAHVALGGKKIIKTVGLVSGGAYRQITDAAQEGLDAYITGNFDEPVWHQAFEEKINFFAMGHSATEQIGPKAIGEYLRDQFNLEVKFIDIFNPF